MARPWPWLRSIWSDAWQSTPWRKYRRKRSVWESPTTAMTPYFRYWQSGVQHEVWFEDVRSLKAKFDLIKELDLSGAGYWQIMNYFRANWLLLADMFEIKEGILWFYGCNWKISSRGYNYFILRYWFNKRLYSSVKGKPAIKARWISWYIVMGSGV